MSKLYPRTTSLSGNIALHYTRDKCFQRDVEIEIDSIDKGGNFMGTLFLDKADFGVSLISDGLGKVMFRSAERLPNFADYKKAEENAKLNLVGVWKDWDASAELERKKVRMEERDAERNTEKTPEKFHVTVTEILSGDHFFYQVVGEEADALTDMMNLMHDTDFTSQVPYNPYKVGELVAAQFTIDDTWYRGAVTKGATKDSESYEITFIDYGNKELLTSERIRMLPSEFNESALPRQSHKGKLVYVTTPPLDDEFGRDSAILFKELVWGKTLVATSYNDRFGGEPGVTQLSLGDPGSKIFINAALVMSGLASVERRKRANDFYQTLKAEEEKAKQQRLNIWQYGDLPDSDDERQEEKGLLR